jgi:hypothetical protein
MQDAQSISRDKEVPTRVVITFDLRKIFWMVNELALLQLATRLPVSIADGVNNFWCEPQLVVWTTFVVHHS